ncbi:MAG TPA: lactate utilization protein [Xanthobacteraceae bacterium]|jgi:L-lactate dehydrogenase complex protein LldG
MSSRDLVLGSIRRSLGVNGREAPRKTTVEDRIVRHPRGLIPARAQKPPTERMKVFKDQVEGISGTVQQLGSADEVPAAVSAYLRSKNLPMRVRRGDDARLQQIPWDSEKTLEVSTGRSDGKQLAAVSYAFGGAAESGTLVLLSGPDNPTTLNFLPDHHLVIIDAKDVAGDYETVWDRLRKKFGEGKMPRAVNWITGPSRSGDIEQKTLLGAHGPRSLHVLIVGKP